MSKNVNQPLLKRRKPWRRGSLKGSFCLAFMLVLAMLQEAAAQSVQLNMTHTDLAKMVAELSRQAPGYQFTYEEQSLVKIKVSDVKIGLTSLQSALSVLKKQFGLNYLIDGKVVVVRYDSSFKSLRKQQTTGTVSGKIVDEESGDRVPGATIVIGEKTISSGSDGAFTVVLVKGRYTATVSYVGYGTKQISDVEVRDGEIFPLAITLKRGKGNMQEVTVISSARRESMASHFLRQKNNLVITDGISAEQIGRTPDKNIGETLKRVSGVNVLENKYVVVRGLSERYNSAMINNQIMPSTEMNRKQFSFDLIPASMVDNIVVYKSISADKSAEFGGGLVEVNTKTIPSNNSFTVSFGESYNDKTTGKNFKGLNFDNRSYWGSASTDRQLLGRTDWKNVDDVRAAYTRQGANARSFSSNWQLANYRPPVSPNFQASFGHVIHLKNDGQLGFVASASWRNTWQTSDIKMGRNGYTGSDLQKELYGFDGKRYGFTSNVGGIAGVGYAGKRLKVDIQTMYLRTLDQQLVLGTGVLDDHGESVGYFDLTAQTSLWQSQLKGERGLGKKGIKLNWMTSYTLLDRRKPDNHQMDASYLGTAKDGPENEKSDFSIEGPHGNGNLGSVLRSWSRSFEKNLGWTLDLSAPVKFNVARLPVSNVLKTGYAGWRKDRLFWVVNTDSRGFSSSDYQPMNEAFDPAFNPGGTIVIDPFSDQYHNTASLHAGYVMLDSKIGRKLRVSGGVRGEYYDLTHISTVQERLVENIMLQNPNSNLDYSDLLDHEAKFNLFPSAGLTYGLTPKMNLRFSYSKSIIRPDMRELAFFREYDFELGGTYQGNAPMLATRLQNYDLRYEWFPSPDEILSFSLFYKKIIHPMEIYDVGNRIYELRNDLVAKNKGIEVEIRKSFAFTHLPVLRNLSLYANFTRLFSKVTPMTVGYGNIDPSRPGKLFVIYKPQAEVERPQAGASNYTYNAGAYYDTKWVSVSLSYNYITNRVFRASETYQESLFETPLPSMDGQVCVNLLKNKARFKCNVSNILGKVNRVYSKREGSGSTTLLYERGDFINFEANPGRTYGIAFDYHF